MPAGPQPASPTQPSDLELEPQPNQTQTGAGSPAPDVLKSKLLIGEFVVLSQNYSHSAAQRSLLAENIVKLVSCAQLDRPMAGPARADLMIGPI